MKLVFLTIIIFAFSSTTYSQKSISCLKTDNGVADGLIQTIVVTKKSKTIKGKLILPDDSIATGNIIIYKNPYNKNDIWVKEIQQIEIDENEIVRCKTNHKGKFKIDGLSEGFYLLKIGLSESEGFDPTYLLVEISRKSGDKRKLTIGFDIAI